MIENKKPTLENLLQEIEKNVTVIKKRFYYLNNFVDEVNKVTFEKRLIIRNDIIWQMLVDSYAMLVIDLASLCHGMIEPGGFFNKLKEFSGELRVKSYRKIADTEIIGSAPSDLKNRIQVDFKKAAAQHIKDAFFRLFPDLQGSDEMKANDKHINALKTRFVTFAAEVRNDRDKYHAHRYQKKKGNINTQSLKLTLAKIETHFEHLEQIISDISLVTTNTSHVYSDLNADISDSTCRDLVDLVSIGSIFKIIDKFDISGNKTEEYMSHHRLKKYLQLRDEFYKNHQTPL